MLTDLISVHLSSGQESTKGMRQSESSDAQSLESERRAQRKYLRVFPKTVLLWSFPKPGRGAGKDLDG
jgi:hypothetical protein